MTRRMTFLLLLCFSAAAPAQTTRPAPPAWDRTVASFSKAVSAGDPDAANALLAPHAVVCPFPAAARPPDDKSADPDKPPGAEKLLDALAGGSTLGAHAYLFPPAALAQDLSDDVTASRMPDELKQAIVLPDDEAARKRAAGTAVQWVGQVLKATKNQPIGVIVLWPADNAGDPSSSTPRRPTFVLMKGIATADGGYQIILVVYGDPLGR